jgi:hypothetical protein
MLLNLLTCFVDKGFNRTLLFGSQQITFIIFNRCNICSHILCNYFSHKFYLQINLCFVSIFTLYKFQWRKKNITICYYLKTITEMTIYFDYKPCVKTENSHTIMMNTNSWMFYILYLQTPIFVLYEHIICCKCLHTEVERPSLYMPSYWQLASWSGNLLADGCNIL